MINPNELRLGNLIIWNPQLCHPATTLSAIPVEVASIQANEIGFIAPSMEHRVEPFEDDLLQAEAPQKALEEFEPRVLTPELLQQNCQFIRDDKGVYSLDTFTLSRLGDDFNYGNGKASTTSTTIKYVHQLQNLYFVVTGKDLEITV